MSVTLDKDGILVATGPTDYLAFVNTSTVIVVNFSNGTRIAITDFDDRESNDPWYGIEAASAGTEVANMWMYGMNSLDFNATFRVYDYTGGSLGTLIYTYLNTTDFDATIQFRYNTITNALSIYTEPNGYIPQSDGTISNFSGTLATTSVVCFLRGTYILTDRGEVAVETLAVGDRVATRFGGLRPIVWIGTQRFDGRFARAAAAPVRFHPGSLGAGLPHTDLFVSPGHAMLVGEVLAHAGALLNGDTITQDDIQGPIDYFHIDLGRHDCVLANGAWAESYFEDHNRDSFHNAADFHKRCPGHAPHRQPSCLPILTTNHPDLPGLRASLTPAHAHGAIAEDTGPYLLADGRRIALIPNGEGTWQADLPASLRHLRLYTRTIRPSTASGSLDRRTLGVMVHAIKIGATDLNLAILDGGWYPLEQDGAQRWRWTAGDAVIPTAGTADGPRRLTLYGWYPPAVAPLNRRLALAC